MSNPANAGLSHPRDVAFGGEGGIDSGLAGPRPAGALRASKIAVGDFVEPTELRVGGEGGIDSGLAGPRPAGALRASKIAVGDFVEPTELRIGGEGGIRTHGSGEGTPVFKTGAFNRS